MKIREGFERAELPMPKIESAYGGVKVTFQRNNVNSGQASTQTGSQTSTQTSTRTSTRTGSQTSYYRILDIIKKNSKVTTAEMASEIGISPRMVAKYLKKFKSDGLIIRKGGRFGGEWVILREKNKWEHASIVGWMQGSSRMNTKNVRASMIRGFRLFRPIGQDRPETSRPRRFPSAGWGRTSCL